MTYHDNSLSDSWESSKKGKLKASQLSNPLISVVYKWKECSIQPKWKIKSPDEAHI